jgi:amicyanin
MDPVLANAATASKPRRSPWRIAALGAATTVALAACGASAAGTRSTSTPVPPTSAAPGGAATAAPGATAAPAPAATAAVGIVNFKFTPAALTVKVGTTVVWTNNDAIAHTVNFMTGGINSSVLNKNDQFSHTFSAPGTYDYICSIHPFMHGSVTVTA